MLSGFRSLVRHTAVYGTGNLLGRAVSVVLLPLYVRRLTTEENGVIVLAFAFIGFTAVFYSMGLNQALIRYLSIREDDRLLKLRLSTVFWTLLSAGGVLSWALWFWASDVSLLLLDTRNHVDILQLIAVIIFLDTLSEPLFSYLRARQRSSVFSGIRLVQHTLQIGLTVYLIAALDQGAKAVFISNVVSSAFALVAVGCTVVRQLSFIFSGHQLRRLLAFGIPFVPSALALLAINLSDRFLVRHFLGLAEAGVYGVAYKLTVPMALIVRSFQSAWAPAVLAEARSEDTRALCARVTTYVALGGVGFFLLTAAVSGELIRLVSGANADTYFRGHSVVPVVTFAYVLYGLYIALTAGIYVEARTRVLPPIIAVGAGVNIWLNIYLLPRIGIEGAAWSTVGAYSLMTAALFIVAKRVYPVPYEIGRLIKVALVGGVCTLLIVNNLHNQSLTGLIARLCFVAVYPFLLWGVGFFRAGEWDGVKSLLLRKAPDADTDGSNPPEIG